MVIYSFCIHIFVISHMTLFVHMQYDETTEITKTGCRQSNQLLGSDKNEKFDFIEIVQNETLLIECHYCNENEISESKVWFKIEQFNLTAHEVEFDMHTNAALNRISVTTDHTLTIHNITMEDSGTYYCHGLQGQESENMFNYIVDIIFNSSSVDTVQLTQWKQYHDDYFSPINQMFLNSNESDYRLIRNDFKTKLELVTEWEVNWRTCEICGRPKGEGIQEKYGYCRIKIHNDENQNINLNASKHSEKIKYFLKSPQISCKSMLLAALFPAISNRTKVLSDFILVQKCDGICNPDAEGVNRGWKAGKSKGFKYRKIIVLDEGSHLTLICPESTLENTITWRKNGKKLKQGESEISDNESEPHVIVDTFNALYLILVTSEEAGNYTCQVDDIRMQQVRIFIQPRSKILTKEFQRHLIYLSFILSVTFICYCGGLVITCNSKHKFRRYSQIVTEID